jgi:hypothetical protein
MSAPANLVNPHDPSPACDETHCWSHGIDEPGEGAYRRCFECGHVYRSAEELQREWVANAPPDLADPGKLPPAEEIFFCSLCGHDW